MAKPYVGVKSSSALGHLFSLSCCRTMVMKRNTSFRATSSPRHFRIPIPNIRTLSTRLLFSSLFSFRNLSGLNTLGSSQIVLYKIDKSYIFIKESFYHFVILANFPTITLFCIKCFTYVWNSVNIHTYVHIGTYIIIEVYHYYEFMYIYSLNLLTSLVTLKN